MSNLFPLWSQEDIFFASLGRCWPVPFNVGKDQFVVALRADKVGTAELSGCFMLPNLIG